MNIVGHIWVFKLKHKPDGSIDCHKARLVAKGFNQLPGIDFANTFSPVVKPITIRTILALLVSCRWSIKQIDIQNAFLHGFLDKEVYMKQPLGFVHPQYPHHICKLHNALYGLKQAPRTWFSRLSSKLLELGFHGSLSDTSLFISHQAKFHLYVLIYVDDIIITGSSSQAVDSLTLAFGSDFAVKNLGDLLYFLGIEAHCSQDGLFLCQKRYILSLLKRTNMVHAKPIIRLCLQPISSHYLEAVQSLMSLNIAASLGLSNIYLS